MGAANDSDRDQDQTDALDRAIENQSSDDPGLDGAARAVMTPTQIDEGTQDGNHEFRLVEAQRQGERYGVPECQQ